MVARFRKVLTPNDVGATNSHQAGFHVPKNNHGLIKFLPSLNEAIVNPDTWITFYDEELHPWEFRYIYYNSKTHGVGTRDEYRITRTRGFLKERGAEAGDAIELFKEKEKYSIRLIKSRQISNTNKIKLKGWQVVY